MAGNKLRWTVRAVIIAVVFIIFLATRFAGLYTDYLWFEQMGYITIFSTILWTKVALFFGVALVAYILLSLNNFIVRKLGKPAIPKAIMHGGSAILSLILGSFAMGNWDTILKMLNQVPFGITDPIFSKDIAFFVFTIPFYSLLLTIALLMIVFTFVIAGVSYLSQNMKHAGPKLTVDQYGNKIPDFSSMKSVTKSLGRGASTHLGILGGLFFIVLGLRHYLARYEILYSTRGVIFGAGFTDAVVSLPALTLLFVVSIVVGLVIVVWMSVIGRKPKLKKTHIGMIAVGIYAVVLIVGTVVIPGITQYYKVSPNELDIERPYIEHAIKYTRLAYGLDDVAEQDYPVSQNLTAADIENNPETIQNIRLLDWRPLMQTYKQLQEIRLYYDFMDVDIDRYTIDGEYRQVMLSPRELAVRQLAPQARTWLNEHVVYTHGYGVTMSPVNKVTKEGQPEFLIKDIPPQYTVEEETLKIDRPEIYYGEHRNDFVIVGTTQREFDYPKGDQNKYTFYDGKGGVPVGGLFSRIMMTIRFGDTKLLISSTITDESKILLYTNIVQRIDRISPFIYLDKDPYMVISEGRLYWIQDGYTASDRYPYSEPSGGINYIRNAVKIVVDAYDGTVDYYIQEPDDPLIVTWDRIFPKQFKSMDEMPEDLKKHIRYPEGLFLIQAEKYATYHMKDPSVFYNKEDVWDIPNEIYGQGQQVKMEPYYVILKLPGWDREEFTMMIPFTPRKKDNMIAWMAAKSDENYGELILFKFPKDKLVYGPMQIEARIDQDAEISEQLTLWSQKGSSVTRGNVLVIPIESSLLYVEPLYIQAEKSQMPELKRVIVSDGTSVVMEETFEKAIAQLLKERGQDLPTPVREEGDAYTLADAQKTYEDAIAAAQSGDWASYGGYMQDLGAILGELVGE